MQRKLLILSDRTNLIDNLINTGDRALTDGFNHLLAHYWPGTVLSAGWKNFPYYSIRTFPPDAGRKQIRRIFDSWCAQIDQADSARGRRQRNLIGRCQNSWFQNNLFVQALDRRLHKVKTRGLIETIAPYLLRDAFRDRFKTLVRAVDTVAFNGGGLIADHLGYYLPGYLLELYYAHRQGKHVVTLNQTVAVSNPLLRKMVSEVYRDLDFHVVREPPSQEALVNLGVEPRRIRVAPDTAFAAGQMTIDAPSRGQATTPPRPPKRIAIIPRGDRGLHLPFWQSVFQQGIAEKKYRLSVVHTCQAHDHRLTQSLRKRLPLEVIDWRGDYHRIIRTLAGFDCVLTDRYHGAIFAILASTPVIGLKSTTFKIDGLFELCDYALPVFDIRLPEAAVQVQLQLDRILSNGEKMRTKMAAIRRMMITRLTQAYADIEHWTGGPDANMPDMR